MGNIDERDAAWRHHAARASALEEAAGLLMAEAQSYFGRGKDEAVTLLRVWSSKLHEVPIRFRHYDTTNRQSTHCVSCDEIQSGVYFLNRADSKPVPIPTITINPKIDAAPSAHAHRSLPDADLTPTHRGFLARFAGPRFFRMLLSNLMRDRVGDSALERRIPPASLHTISCTCARSTRIGAESIGCVPVRIPDRRVT